MTTETCEKCKRKYLVTRDSPNCPQCGARELQIITPTPTDVGDVLAALWPVAEAAVEAVVETALDVAGSVGDTFDGGGGDFGGGGASGDW